MDGFDGVAINLLLVPQCSCSLCTTLWNWSWKRCLSVEIAALRVRFPTSVRYSANLFWRHRFRRTFALPSRIMHLLTSFWSHQDLDLTHFLHHLKHHWHRALLKLLDERLWERVLAFRQVLHHVLIFLSSLGGQIFGAFFHQIWPYIFAQLFWEGCSYNFYYLIR